ncbi:MAG: TlpA family protein disulfide reductase [Bacteroidales bacterium]|nr:TlpA family protein disulfide reductase [Bacteroidales bacterium]
MKKSIVSFVIFILMLTSGGILAQNSATIATDIVDLNDPKYSNESFQSILDEYKGKVVYLDFWASWCGPCKREMPYSQKLQEKFKGKDVVFLYFSVDRNGQPWRNMIDQLTLTGQHYRANASVHQELNQQFNVRSIPRYILIDKNGEVVSANALRPSNPSVVQEINKLL